MKHNHALPGLTALLCVLLLLLTLASCTDMDAGKNGELADQFLDYVIADDYDAAYGMVKATVTDADFRAYWTSVQAAAEGATSHETEEISRRINTVKGITDRTTAYRVCLDNGKTVFLRVVTRDDIEGIAGIHFSDVTEFLRDTQSVVSTVQTVLWVVSGLCVDFTVWMLVDCLRRKIKYKAVWALVILFGAVLTVTVGEASNLSFTICLFFQPSSITADMGLVAVVTKTVLPAGALLYLFLRKRFTVTES